VGAFECQERVETGTRLIQSQHLTHETHLIEAGGQKEVGEGYEMFLRKAAAAIQVVPPGKIRVVQERVVLVAVAGQAAHR
jgi:hypothetical protein